MKSFWDWGDGAEIPEGIQRAILRERGVDLVGKAKPPPHGDPWKWLRWEKEKQPPLLPGQQHSENPPHHTNKITSPLHSHPSFPQGNPRPGRHGNRASRGMPGPGCGWREAGGGEE